MLTIIASIIVISAAAVAAVAVVAIGNARTLAL